MHENHNNEQYFFTEGTIAFLAETLSGYERPCCICAPMVGQRLVELGHKVTILDIDPRFSQLPGFAYYDLYRPHWIDETFDIILCDPPFFNVSLSQLFVALRSLSHHNFEQPLWVSYLSRRSEAILGAFAPFGLKPTGFFPEYVTVQKSEKNQIEFFGNVDFRAITD